MSLTISYYVYGECVLQEMQKCTVLDFGILISWCKIHISYANALNSILCIS